jgi:serine/threonine-protein kinase HipA
MRRCLCCYQPLNDNEVDYHPRCAKRFFGQFAAPMLPYTRKDISKLAQVVVESRQKIQFKELISKRIETLSVAF